MTGCERMRTVLPVIGVTRARDTSQTENPLASVRTPNQRARFPMTNITQLRRRTSLVKVVMTNGKRFSFVIDEEDEQSLARGRQRWKELKLAGAELEYWRHRDGKLLRIE
jgi:hypothetical protein